MSFGKELIYSLFTACLLFMMMMMMVMMMMIMIQL